MRSELFQIYYGVILTTSLRNKKGWESFFAGWETKAQSGEIPILHTGGHNSSMRIERKYATCEICIFTLPFCFPVSISLKHQS